MNRVGNLLRERREQLGLSKENIIKKLRIQIVYLDAIENGDFAFFRGQEYYQQVFVGSYADIMALDKKQIMSMLQEDYDDFLSGKVSEPAHQAKKKETELNQSERPVHGSIPDKLLQAASTSVAAAEPSLLNNNVATGPSLLNNNVTEQSLLNSNAGPNQSPPPIQPMQSDPAVIDDLISQISTKPTSELNDLAEMLKREDTPTGHDSSDQDALLNSSIFDEIKKIEDKMDQQSFATQNVNGLDTQDITQQFSEADLNVNIDEPIEEAQPKRKTIKSLFSRTPQSEEVASTDTTEQDVFTNSSNNNPNMDQVQVFSGLDLSRPLEDDEIVVPQEQLISNEAYEDQINMEDLAHAERTTDRDGKTAIDLKVAKALGGQEIEVDPADAKQIKRDKIIDWILVIVAIAVVVYIAFFFFDKG